MDIRDCFWEQVYEEMVLSDSIFIVSIDADAFGLNKIKDAFSKRVIDAGISEQNAVTVACGLAESGFKVIVFGLASFLTSRAYEQIRFNMCASKLPITIAGLGPGFSFSWDGPSHHAISDIGLMRLIPEINIWNPITENSMKYSVKESLSNNYPNYIRIDKGEYPELYSENDVYRGYKFINSMGKNVIISTGYMTHIVKSMNLNNIKHIDLFKIKPADLTLCVGEDEYVFVVEEHQKTGGIHGLFYGENLKVVSISIPDKQYFKYGSREYLHKIVELDKESVENRIKGILGWNTKR